MKILFVASEGLPYSKTGGLADVVDGLPKALHEMGHEVVVLLPRYRGNKVKSVLISSVTVALGDKLHFPAIVEGQPVDGLRYLFVDDPLSSIVPSSTEIKTATIRITTSASRNFLASPLNASSACGSRTWFTATIGKRRLCP